MFVFGLYIRPLGSCFFTAIFKFVLKKYFHETFPESSTEIMLNVKCAVLLCYSQNVNSCNFSEVTIIFFRVNHHQMHRIRNHENHTDLSILLTFVVFHRCNRIKYKYNGCHLILARYDYGGYLGNSEKYLVETFFTFFCKINPKFPNRFRNLKTWFNQNMYYTYFG